MTVVVDLDDQRRGHVGRAAAHRAQTVRRRRIRPLRRASRWTPTIMPFKPNPTRPTYAPPPGAVDAHCHVFGPADVFPYAPERKYTPCDAPKEKLFALRDFLGFSRNVIVQATCHGADNRALVDALKASNGLARGVATVRAGCQRRGVEGARRSGRARRALQFRQAAGRRDAARDLCLDRRAHRQARLAHRRLFRGARARRPHPFLNALPTTIVVDHMGRPDLAKGVDHPDFRRFVDLMAANPRIWSKVTCPERLSISGPPAYDDFVPFARRAGAGVPRPRAVGHRLAAPQHDDPHAR